MPCLPSKYSLQKHVAAVVEATHGVQDPTSGIDSGTSCITDVQGAMQKAMDKVKWTTLPDGAHVK